MATELIDLSHPIENGMETYPGIRPPKITTYLTREEGQKQYAQNTTFAITSIDMVANTGTYIDSPFHRFENGADLAQLSLNSLANIPGVLIRTNDRQIEPNTFKHLELSGKAILFHTGWSQHFRTDLYLKGYPFLDATCGAILANKGVTLVGIDSPNIDDHENKSRPVHTALLEAGIPIVEHLTGLSELPLTGFSFFAVPPMICGFTSFPVRAFALINPDESRLTSTLGG